jgi:hypothetical protein
MKTFFIFIIMGLSEYLLGLFMGMRQAQQEIKERRLDMGLDPETGEDNNAEYQCYAREMGRK